MITAWGGDRTVASQRQLCWVERRRCVGTWHHMMSGSKGCVYF
jgi:hypothetical protein